MIEERFRIGWLVHCLKPPALHDIFTIDEAIRGMVARPEDFVFAGQSRHRDDLFCFNSADEKICDAGLSATVFKTIE